MRGDRDGGDDRHAQSGRVRWAGSAQPQGGDRRRRATDWPQDQAAADAETGGELGLRLLDKRNDALASIFGLGLHQDLAAGDWTDAPLRDRGITPRSATQWLEQQARGRPNA